MRRLMRKRAGMERSVSLTHSVPPTKQSSVPHWLRVSDLNMAHKADQGYLGNAKDYIAKSVASFLPDQRSDGALGFDKYRYKMDFDCLGTCLIINNKNFKKPGLSCRTGTDVDAANAEKTFKELGYKVRRKNDQTVEQMKRLMRDVSEEHHIWSASFVCVLLSHGDKGVIYGTDGPVELEHLTQYYKGDWCKELVGKPKLFFIQACRGHKTDRGIQMDGAVQQTSERIPVEADFFYAYATAPGYLSWRDTTKGSWFIQALCEMLQGYGKKLELMHVMTRVNNEVALNFGFGKTQEMPCIVYMLTKEMYFTQ